MDTKITKVIALNILLIGLVLFLSGCGNQVYTPEVSLISPTLTITTSLPSATATVSATEAPLPPYPKSAENFVKKPSISGAEARKIITEKGAGEDLKALENWYKSEGIIGSGMSNVAVPVVYQEGGNFNWNLMVKKNNGNFLKFTITSGKETDQLVRAMGMITYLGEKPSFEVSELKDPAEMENLTQQVIWDRSGWSVIGAFQGETLIGWFNADKNIWVVEQNPQVEVTPTPEYEPIHSSLEIEGNVDGVPVKVTFAIGQDMYEREDLPLDKWIINPEAQEFLSPRTVEEVLAKEIMKAHYFAWQGDDFVNRKPVTFEEYIQRLKDGEDMSYEIAAAVPKSVLESTVEKVDPLKPVTFMLVDRMGGYSGGLSARDSSTFYYVTDGSLRIEKYVSLESLKATIPVTYFEKNDPRIARAYIYNFGSSLIGLSMDPEYQKVDQNKSKLNAYTAGFFKERPEIGQLTTSLWFNPTGKQGIENYTNLLLIKEK